MEELCLILDRGKEGNVSRRVFLYGAGAVVGGSLLWHWRTPRVIAAVKSEPGEVTIVQFSDDGKRLGKVKIAKVMKTEEEWRKQLSPGEFEITRHADTEIAYTGKYWNLHDKGLFRCICCDNALFSSETKFDSGTGWPSFWAPIARRMCGRSATLRWAWSGLRFRARSVMPIWGMCLTMGRSRRGCGIA